MKQRRHIKKRLSRIAAAAALGLAAMWPGAVRAVDVSPPALLQWFESSYQTIERRMADVFVSGYGSLWLPPPGRADQGGLSVGYDVYDRFDLGSPGRPTLYGTEKGLKAVASKLHRAGGDLYIDYVINHNGFSDLGTPGFVASGGYPGFAITLPNAIDGDFHSVFAGGVIEGRLAGLVDIDHGTNHQFIRHPVDPNNPSNIPLAGTTPDGAGRLANVPTASNRRFYPDRQLQPIMLFDPRTGEQNIAVYPFNLENPMAGDPVSENAMGLLMRYAQWMVQEIGVDGFRIDAAKHVEGFALDYFDRAVYRSNPRRLLDGSRKHVFSFSEVFDGDKGLLQSHIVKTINPSDPGRIGGNRDVLDFPLYFALKANLTDNGLTNDWRNVVNAAMDYNDDQRHNGSQGVMFVQSHDDGGPHLSNVAYAYTLMHPGNALVYFNGKEFGDNRDFPRDGRGDALGGVFGDRVQDLVEIRNSHGRGNYRERWLEKELLAFERSGSALVLLSNRMDGGFDSRTLNVDLPWGTYLVELTGNAASSTVDPFNDIPEVIQVFNDCFECQSKVNVRFPRNRNANGVYHGRGYLVYGLQTPQAPAGVELTNVHSVLEGGDPNSTGYENGITRLTDLHVIKADSFKASLHTSKVYLLGSLRDHNADGDSALIKVDGGLDINGNGAVDFTTPGTVQYGFENFVTRREPGYSSNGGSGGDGFYEQTIDATQLSEGEHFIEVIAFRKGTGGPPVFSSFRKVVYIDRLAPVSGIDSFEPWDSGNSSNRDLIVRSLDMTGDSMHVFLNLPATVSEQDILDMAVAGQNRAARWDRDLFKYGFFGVPSGNNVATIVTFEITGTSNVQRITGIGLSTSRGMGFGDLNFDGIISASDLASVPGAFEQVLYSQDAIFNPAADGNGDGRVTTADLLLLGEAITAAAAPQSVVDEYRAMKRRRVDVNRNGTTDAFDLDELRARFGSSDWVYDIDGSGTTDEDDVDVAVFDLLMTRYGDVTLDGRVGIADLSALATHFGQPGGWGGGDVNGDGFVTIADLSILAVNFGFDSGMGSAAARAGDVPAPTASAAMLLLGVMMRRRGRAIASTNATA